MKKLLFILITLLVFSESRAQQQFFGKVLTLDTLPGSITIEKWKKIDSTNVVPGFFPAGTTLPAVIQIDSGGTGATTRVAAAANLLPYLKDDGGAPVQPPVVATFSKGLSWGDTVTTNAWASLTMGSRLMNTGARSVLVAPNSGFLNTQAGNLVVNIGSGNSTSGVGSVVLGSNNTDFVTSNVDDGTNGYNVIFGGFSQNNHTTDNLNIIGGYNVQVYGSFNVALGGNTASGTASNNNTSIGYQAFISGSSSKKFQLCLGSHLGNFPHGNYDSVSIIGSQPNMFAQNADEYVLGGNNVDGIYTDLALQLSDGAKHGNAAKFDIIRAHFNGDVEIGHILYAAQNVVAQTSLGGATTPTAGTYAKDNAIVAWGAIAADSTISAQYGHFTITHPATGQYVITLPASLTAGVVTATPVGSFCLINTTFSGATVTVNTAIGTIGSPTAADRSFYFIVTGRP